MKQGERQLDWREKVNPIFPLAIQVIQIIPRLVRPQDGVEPKQVLIEACVRAISHLPDWSADMTDIDMSDWAEHMGSQPEISWLADPEVCHFVSLLLGRLKGLPKTAFTKHFSNPHWWMTQDSWSEFLQERGWAGSFLNILSLLHLNLPLPELTERVSDGDFDLETKLFRKGRSPSEDGKSARILEKLLQPLKDGATKIVARRLLSRGNPPGYQLPIRMVLFFGWDFGLSDLSISELHDFLLQLGLVPPSYDPESLRKYRDRTRQLIEKNRKPHQRSLRP